MVYATHMPEKGANEESLLHIQHGTDIYLLTYCEWVVGGVCVCVCLWACFPYRFWFGPSQWIWKSQWFVAYKVGGGVGGREANDCMSPHCYSRIPVFTFRICLTIFAKPPTPPSSPPHPQPQDSRLERTNIYRLDNHVCNSFWFLQKQPWRLLSISGCKGLDGGGHKGALIYVR